MADILFELGCEELPPKALYGLSKALFDGVCKQLTEQGFAFAEDSRWYASPRRLAFILRDASEQLEDSTSEKRGPAVAAAFDDEGNAKPAALGFARSVGVEVGDLAKVMTDKGEYLSYQVTEKGQHINDVLPQVIAQAIKQLPIPKPMRWGNNDFAFIRPVHWMVLMNGENILDMSLFDIKSGQQTRGHRFHHNTWVKIPTAIDYVSVLQDAEIMVDHLEREALITQQVCEAAASVDGTALINQALLQEVASITEKPVAVLGDFSTDFLTVPREALISSMEKHQKYFPVVNADGQLMPYFIALANIDTKNPAAVKKGFEKVITPRLADARFFWEKDKARPLADNIPLLEKMVFEQTLGTIADKTARIAKLLNWLAPQMNFEAAEGDRAAELMKSDLMSDMVDEFPDLQGLMGGYYAAEQGESDEVAKAIRDQYLPKFVGDTLPETALGQAVSMADKMDTLCGIFAVGKKPSGSKDPFALRRAALSVINILKDKELEIDYSNLIHQTIKIIEENCGLEVDQDSKNNIELFFEERLRVQFINNGYSHDVFSAANSLATTTIADLEVRLKATEEFKQSQHSKTLIEANKRSFNIIAKSDLSENPFDLSVNKALFQSKFETNLNTEIEKIQSDFDLLVKAKKYAEGYQLLATLAEPVDQYFENVMVNDENVDVRKNRLVQLAQFCGLTKLIADLSKLVKS